MKVKANSRIESIFSYAVAMDNRGLRNTIHCIGPEIYIVNSDHSMILRFSLRKNEVQFEQPASFNANDYDSPNFEIKGGKIIFETAEGGYERKKICALVGYSAEDLRAIYRKNFKAGKSADFSFYLAKDCCALLEENLSHTEISIEAGKLILRQRNVYDGTIIEISPRQKGLLDSGGRLPVSFGPVGLKTKDFSSLFSYSDSLEFFPAGDFLLVKDYRKQDFDGILSFCMYDEIIDLYKERGDEPDGRKEQKIRRSK